MCLSPESSFPSQPITLLQAPQVSSSRLNSRWGVYKWGGYIWKYFHQIPPGKLYIFQPLATFLYHARHHATKHWAAVWNLAFDVASLTYCNKPHLKQADNCWVAFFTFKHCVIFRAGHASWICAFVKCGYLVGKLDSGQMFSAEFKPGDRPPSTSERPSPVHTQLQVYNILKPLFCVSLYTMFPLTQ